MLFEGVKIFAAWLIAELSFGYVILRFFATHLLTIKRFGHITTVYGTYVKGSIVLSVGVATVFYGLFEKALDAFNYQQPDAGVDEGGDRRMRLVENQDPAFIRARVWAEGLRRALTDPVAGLETGDWEAERARLQTLWSSLVWPLFRELFLKMMITSVVISSVVNVAAVHLQLPNFAPMVSCQVRLV